MTAELEALAGVTAETDTSVTTATAPAPDPNAPEEKPEPSQVDQLTGILLAAGQAGAMRFPSLAQVYTEEKCRARAEAFAPALERLGLTINFGQTMVFMGALGAAGMMLVETRNAIIADIRAEQVEAAQKGAITITRRAPGADGTKQADTPETPVHSQMALYQKTPAL